MTRILVATSMGGYAHAAVCDRVLIDSLTLRGAQVDSVLCDAAIPTCQMIKFGRAEPEQLRDGVHIPYCDRCIASGSAALSGPGHRLLYFSQYLTSEDRARAAETSRAIPFADIQGYVEDGLPVGDHSYAGALRYFARGSLEAEPLGEAVLRRYLEAGLLTVYATRSMMQRERYDVVVAHHGIYVPQGLICETAKAAGARIVTYNPAYRKHCFVFSHDASYHFTMIDEPTETWTGLDMRPDLKELTQGYLNSRRTGSGDWIWFHDQPKENADAVLLEIGADPARPYVSLLTSVVWDAQLHYKANAFPNMMAWILATIEYWRQRTDDLQLIIRVHPAEVRGMVPSRQKVVEELERLVGVLPANVFVIAPENQASTYALCDKANAVLIFNTKTGVEAAALGQTVVVAGEAWIRGKGFAIDVSSPEHYFEVLDGLPLSTAMTPEIQALAEKYAFHFFFRRMIPLPFIEQVGKAKFAATIKDNSDLQPGRWPGLDVICEGILTGSPFVFPAELLTPSEIGIDRKVA